MTTIKNLSFAVLALALLGACGGRETKPITYAGEGLDSKSVVFGTGPVGGVNRTFVVFSERGDACAQFDGLGCDVTQPLTGTTLSFVVDGYREGTVSASAARATFRSYSTSQAIVDPASTGEVSFEKVEGDIDGKFNLTFPRTCLTRDVATGGAECVLEREFTARACDAMAEWMERCKPALQ